VGAIDAASTGLPDASAFPSWTFPLAWILLATASACAAWVAIDVVRRPQPMAVMNVVWPIVMLFGSVVWLIFYLRTGRADRQGRPAPARSPRWISVAIETNHCGAGCALGDIAGESILIAFPALAAVFGAGWLSSAEPVPGWVLSTLLAFGFGILLQYFAIAPMRDLTVREGIREALKADAASIAAWQVGMIGVMALVQLVWLPRWIGGPASPVAPQFWVLMQFAMMAGYACSYPVNWWLVRRGIKTPM